MLSLTRFLLRRSSLSRSDRDGFQAAKCNELVMRGMRRYVGTRRMRGLVMSQAFSGASSYSAPLYYQG
jgi:hypothetical protein